MADHSVGAWDELHESEASQACLFVNLVCFFSLLLRFAVFLNATRSDRNVHCLPLREKSGSMQFVETKERSSRSPRELFIKFVRYDRVVRHICIRCITWTQQSILILCGCGPIESPLFLSKTTVAEIEGLRTLRNLSERN